MLKFMYSTCGLRWLGFFHLDKCETWPFIILPLTPNLFFLSLAWIPLSCNTEICSVDCGSHGVCMGGACRCEEGWTGPACNQRACHPRCAEHGTCKDGKCECSQGWHGEHCTIGRPARLLVTYPRHVHVLCRDQTHPPHRRAIYRSAPPLTRHVLSLSSIDCQRDHTLGCFLTQKKLTSSN